MNNNGTQPAPSKDERLESLWDNVNRATDAVLAEWRKVYAQDEDTLHEQMFDLWPELAGAVEMLSACDAAFNMVMEEPG